MNAPIEYYNSFFNQHESDIMLNFLIDDLDWVNMAGNRMEYYINDYGVPYTYGEGTGQRTYESQPNNHMINHIWTQVQNFTGEEYDVCFLNYYRDGKDQLGWHADDSEGMDDSKHIAIVSFGARREIYFRENQAGKNLPVEKLWLESGSMCLMLPGMQDTHQHRIPKASVQDCGPRVSLTFRGYDGKLV